MQIHKYTYIDVHYKESENKSALKLRKKLIKLGYKLWVEDEGSKPYDYCDQYLGIETIKSLEKNAAKK